MAKTSDSILYLGSNRRDYIYFPTPFISVNTALKHGGIRSRGFLHIVANEACGKTTLSLMIVAEAQKAGLLKEIPVKIGKETYIFNAVFIDVERQYDSEYAESLGVDTDKLLVIRATGFNAMADEVEARLKEGFQMFVLDSIPELISEDELAKSWDDSAKVAETANALTRWLRRLNGLVDDANALFIMINQLRANLSPMAQKKTKPFGAAAIRYRATLSLELARIKRTEDISEIEIFIEKNKQGAQGAKTVVYLNHGQGFDANRDIVEFALYLGIITKAGAWYKFNDVQANGVKQCIEKFDMVLLRKKIQEELRNA